jgi:hypothetical protein
VPVALGGCGPLEPPGVSVDFRELAAAELTLLILTVTDFLHN